MLGSKEYKLRTDACLDELYADAVQKAGRVDPLYGELAQRMRGFAIRGGKRQRPYLAYLAYAGNGGTDTDSLIRAAAGLEVFHSFLLIHDDIIDRDQIRYGGPNLTGQYFGLLDEAGNAPEEALHFAEMAALLAGDVASSLVRTNLYDAPFPAEAKLRCSKLLDEALFYVGGGEYAEALSAPLHEPPMAYARILSIYEYKTARYTFDLPLQFGAVLSGNRFNSAELTAFSVPLGIAFQMRDDYLGLFGDSGTTGKPVLGDLREGKQTALHALAVELADERQKEALERHYGLADAGEADLGIVKEIFEQSGACTLHEREIARFAAKAASVLPALGFAPESTEALATFVDTSVRRDA